MNNIVTPLLLLSLTAAPALVRPAAAAAEEPSRQTTTEESTTEETTTTRASAPKCGASVSKDQAKSTIKDWPEASRNAANQILAKYGNPDFAGCNTLVWMNKSPFQKIAVTRDGARHEFQGSHQDVLSQEISMRVPPDKVSDLEKFDGSLLVDRTKGTVTARGDTEAHNILALNLANEIVQGKRDVDSARQAYAETVQTGVSGKSSELSSGLLYPSGSDTADPDHPYSGPEYGKAPVTSQPSQPSTSQTPTKTKSAADQTTGHPKTDMPLNGTSGWDQTQGY